MNTSSEVNICNLPYGNGTIPCSLPSGRAYTILTNHTDSFTPDSSEQQLVEDALLSPIGSAPLRELAKGKKNVVLIASDHTRPVPSKLIVPPMLREIRAGNPDAQITILIATGCHRETRREELVSKFGEDLVKNERIVIHDCADRDNLVHIGTLPSGGRLEINRLAAEADLLVSEGFIEPHFFAGFSGGRKSVLPGIASRMCVHYNHNSRFMDHPNARTGVLEGNPIHEDMLFAAKAAKLAFIVNVVLDAHGHVIAAYTGNCEAAHAEGAKLVLDMMGVSAQQADIVITTNNGHPLDQNAYQMVKGMCTAEAVCREGGVIIAVGKCADGVGGDSFLRTFRECSDVTALLERFRATPPEETVTDQWQSHIFARILEKHTVIFVSDMDDATVRDLHMLPSKSVADAVRMADEILCKTDGSIAIIPEGISVIIRSK